MNNGNILVRIIVFVILSLATFLLLDFLDPVSLQSPARTATALGVGLVFALFGTQIIKVLNIFDWIAFLSKPFR